MKTGRDLPTIAAELDRQVKNRRDYVAPPNALRIVFDAMRPGNTLTMAGLNGESYGIRPFAHTQIAEYTGIPAKYYDRMRTEAPDLLALNINTWFSQPRTKHEVKRRLVRTLDGDVRAFLSGSYRPLDNVDLLSAVIPTLGERGCKIASAEVTETRLYIKATMPGMEMEVPGSRQRGDVVRAGVMVRNSEVGCGAVAVQPFIDRLVCTNGMVAPDHGLWQAHLGKADGGDDVREMFTDNTKRLDDASFWSKVRDVVAGTFKREVFEKIVAKFGEATQDKIESANLQRVVEVTTKRLGLTEGQGDAVLKRLIEGADLSRWGLANAITRTAEDQESYDDATDLEKAGGKVIELAPTDWKAISEAK